IGRLVRIRSAYDAASPAIFRRPPFRQSRSVKAKTKGNVAAAAYSASNDDWYSSLILYGMKMNNAAAHLAISGAKKLRAHRYAPSPPKNVSKVKTNSAVEYPMPVTVCTAASKKPRPGG